MDAIFDLARVSAGGGWGITLTGMIIVFAALVFIAVVIGLVPHCLVILNKYIPEPQVAAKKARTVVSTDDELAVSIAVAFHQQNTGK